MISEWMLWAIVLFGSATTTGLGFSYGWLRRGDWDEPYIRLAYRAGRKDLHDELVAKAAKALPNPNAKPST